MKRISHQLYKNAYHISQLPSYTNWNEKQIRKDVNNKLKRELKFKELKEYLK